MSTYSTNLALELIDTGDQAGIWGITTNSNLGTLLEQAISGYVTQEMADADQTITIPDGATGVARNMYIECKGGLTVARNLIVPTNRKLYFIFNNTTGGFAITVKVTGLTGVSVANGGKMVLVSNGTDIVTAIDSVGGGTVTAVSVATANGMSGSSSGGATPELTLTVGAINLSTATALPLSTGVSGILPTAAGGTAVDNSTGGTANQFWARPDGATGAASYRAVVAADIPTLNQNTTGNAATVTTNANLTGDVTSSGSNATTLAAGSAGNLNSGTLLAARMPALTGDISTTVNTIVTTLATVASSGTTGSSTAIPVITINAKGLTTSISTAAVVAPAGTLSGTTLASGVTASSLTSVGTITSGVWTGTDIAVADGGTGFSTTTAYAVLCGGTTATGPFQPIAGVGTAAQVLTSNGAGALPTFQTAAGGGGITWSAVTVDATMAVDTGSLANKGTLLTLTLPATSAVGKTVRVAGMNAGLWKIAQGTADQYIKFGNQTTITGTSGSLASVLTYDAVELVCIELDKGWVVVSSVGNITVA